MNGADCGCTATPINLRRPEGAAPVGVIKDNYWSFATEFKMHAL